MSQNEEQEVKVYEITNRNTGEKSWQAASNAHDACKLAGWIIGDCYIEEEKPRYKPVPDHDPICLVKIPCKVCTYQWAECIAPAEMECPCRPDTPDLQEWLNQVNTAHLCDYVGQTLSKTDHRQGQKWLPTAEAIKELTAKL